MERRTKFIIVAIIIVFCVITGVAVYTNVTTRWIVDISNTAPTVSLISPSNGSTVNANTTLFNWSSYDADSDPLEHEWFLDLVLTMNSPHKVTQSTGAVTNYTPSSITDGSWYWKVEVSDDEDVNVSETWNVIIKDNATNNFPEMTNYSVYPSTGPVTETFTYNLTYVDDDNNAPTIIRVYIDGVSFNMNEINVSDTNYSDGKQYNYTKYLSIDTHNYSFYVSDGIAVNSTSIFTGPNVTVWSNTLPEITLLTPIPGQIFDTVNVTFNWTVIDIDDNLLYTELWIWKHSTGEKQTYTVSNGTTIQLFSDTYFWQVLAVDEYGNNLSENRTFGVLATGKQCSVTIQADDTTSVADDSFTGDLVITNEGPLESYEVYWYIGLYDGNKRESRDLGSLALTTTVSVSFEVHIPEDLDEGRYYLRAYVYDSSEDTGELIGQDEINVIVEVDIIILTDDDIVWRSLFFDTPRYAIDLEEYPNAEKVKVSASYDYSLLFFQGTRGLKKVEIYLFTSDIFMQLPATPVSATIFDFGGVDEADDATLVIVPNPSITDSTLIFNWLHKNEVRYI